MRDEEHPHLVQREVGDASASPSPAEREVRGVLLSVAYDGTGFHGFAPQPGQRTVAGELLGALRAIDPRIEEVRGASRTDAGVHGRDQRVGFDPSRDLPLSAWLSGTARHLPDSISIRSAFHVSRGFNPRFSSIAKTYRYLLLADARRDPFFVSRAWRVPELAQEDALSRARAEADAAIGTHDFAAFRGKLDRRPTTTRTLSRVEISRDPSDPRLVRVDIRGDAFLYNMVRILVGTVVDVARRRARPGALARALASGDRRDAGITAPPEGLYLERCELEGDAARIVQSSPNAQSSEPILRPPDPVEGGGCPT